jgi:hypothetical protein
MTRGGKRPGAGRPIGTTAKNKKISYTTRLRPDQIDWLRQQKNASGVLEKILDRAINGYRVEWEGTKPLYIAPGFEKNEK